MLARASSIARQVGVLSILGTAGLSGAMAAGAHAAGVPTYRVTTDLGSARAIVYGGCYTPKDEHGQPEKSADPSVPVQVCGTGTMDGAPAKVAATAGTVVTVRSSGAMTDGQVELLGPRFKDLGAVRARRLNARTIRFRLPRTLRPGIVSVLLPEQAYDNASRSGSVDVGINVKVKSARKASTRS